MSRGRSRSSSGSSSRGMSRSSFSSSSRSYHRPMHGNVVIINNHGGGHGGKTSTSALVAMGVFFALIGIILLAIAIPNIGKNQEEYSSTFGTAVSNTVDDGWYYTTYNYSVNGTQYRNMSQEGWEFPETVGNTVVIYYQVSNPNIISEEIPEQTDPTPFLVSGIALSLIGAFLIIIGIKIMKDKKTAVNEKTSNTHTESANHDTIKPKSYCSYCGAQIPEGEHKCPSCGASKK